MDKSEMWMVDNYHWTRSRLLKDVDVDVEVVIRPHVRKRCEDGSPIGREEWDGPLARLNTYERFVLLPLLETDLLIEAADYCAKNSEPARRHPPVPLTYDEAMVMEVGPLLAERLHRTTALADSLAQTCSDQLKPKPETSPLPFKLTKVSVAKAKVVAHRLVKLLDEALKDWAELALELGCRELFWNSDFEFEVMATTPQQYNLAYHAAMLPARSGQESCCPAISDEGEIDPEETILRLSNSWKCLIVEKLARNLGCREVIPLNSGMHIFCLASPEQRANLSTLHWRDHPLHVRVDSRPSLFFGSSL